HRPIPPPQPGEERAALGVEREVAVDHHPGDRAVGWGGRALSSILRRGHEARTLAVRGSQLVDRREARRGSLASLTCLQGNPGPQITSAPAEFAPECTPGRVDWPLSDSTVPMAASTVHGRPGQVVAASWYKVSMAAGMSSVAVTDGVASPPPRSDVMPAPAPAARTATRRTSPATPAATLLARLAGAASRPMLTPTQGVCWRAVRD